MSGRFLRPVLFFGFLVAIGLLSFADRASDMVKGVWDVIRRIGSFGERLVGFDVVDRGDIPFAFDTLGHLTLWSIAGMLAYAAFGRRTSRSFLIVSLITLSAGVEIGQRFLSSTRRPQVSDLIANSVGVTTGVLVAAFVFWLASLFGGKSRSLTQ